MPLDKSSDNIILSKLAISSTASILTNLGFSTTRSSPLYLLNNLLVKFIENLSKDVKKNSELAGLGHETTLNDVLMALEQYDFSLVELDEYLQSVGPFPSLTKLPLLPVKICNSKAIRPFDGEFTMTSTLMNSTYGSELHQPFPVYTNKSSRDLQLVDKCAVQNKMNNTLDSLASPILHFRRKFATRKHQTKPQDQVQKKDVNGNTLFKSVLSNKGLKLRLLNNSANTPPGYFSSRSKKRGSK